MALLRTSILHVDLDAFYAAVEVLDDPSLAGRPVIVGGVGGRGVVAACTYEARAYGVRSAMPAARARRLCPQAVFLPGRHDRYAEMSRRFHVVLASVTPLVEPIALDEAFLDVSGAGRLLGTGPEIARRVRARIYADLGLWASVGVATCKLVAKLASEAAKPVLAGGSAAPGGARGGVAPGRGVVVVEPGDELAFMHPLPVRALWGVGPKTHERLAGFGVMTVGDLAALPVETLVGSLGPAMGRHLHDLAWARDDRAVEPERAAKSIGHEETYARDHHDRAGLHREVVKLSDAVATRLRDAGLAGRTVTLKLRFGDFHTITRSRTAREPVWTGRDIGKVASSLLDEVELDGRGVRLLGVSSAGLCPAATQLSLDETGDPRGPAATWEGVAAAVDEVRKRFGPRAVGPAALLGPNGLDLRRTGDAAWGPHGP